MKKLLMEFLGTFFFLLTVAIGAHPLAIGAMLMAWLYIGAYISGAHYNPAVTLAVATRDHSHWELAPQYMIAQILGGFAAFAFGSFLHGQIVIPAPSEDVHLVTAALVEILLAFVFTLLVLVTRTADKYKNSNIFGFAIGFTIPAIASIGAPISGGLFNPAIAIGSFAFGALRGVSINWMHLLMYVGGALIGGFLAAHVYIYFFGDK